LAEPVAMPDMMLPATDGGAVNPGQLAGWAVFFFYPYTGRPGVPDPEGWDQIPGAHGSTAQALSYSMLYDVFSSQNIKVFGVSFQDTAWQQEFVRRNALAFPLLSDAARSFSSALNLETFKAGDGSFLRRRTMVVHDGIVRHDRRTILAPEADVAAVLNWFGEQLR
jgi:peroxiredoxin